MIVAPRFAPLTFAPLAFAPLTLAPLAFAPLALATLLLAGCHFVPDRQAARTAPAVSSAAGAWAPLPVHEAPPPPVTVETSGQGTLTLTIRWPQSASYRTSALPDSSLAVAIRVEEGGAVLAESIVAKPADGAVTRKKLALPVADEVSVEVKAYPATQPDLVTAVATARGTATGLAIKSGRTATASIVMQPLYPPAVATFSPGFGPVDQHVVISGSNLAVPWAATPSVTFGSRPALVAAYSSQSIEAVAPPSANGPIRVAVDGIATNSAQPFRYGAILAAVTPVATAGSTIALEGLFGPGTTINFPGGIGVPATLQGPGRATAIVPEGATAGDLTVSHAGYTTTPRPFRKATFRLALGQFRTEHVQGMTGRAAERLVTPRNGHGTVRIGRYVYVLGGFDGSDLASVERCRINADGTLGAFETMTATPLVTPRDHFKAVVVGNYVYAIGGANFNSFLRSVERARIDESGNLSAFSVVPGVSLATGRDRFALAVAGRYLYVMGGMGDAGRLSSVERALILEDGQIGPFEQVRALTASRLGPAAEVIGQWLYVIGGRDGGQDTSVERARLDGEGQITAFEAVPGLALQQGRGNHATIVLGDALYAIGGTDSQDFTRTTVERSGIDAAGNLTGFTQATETALWTPRVSIFPVLTDGYLHLIGGWWRGPFATGQRASIRADDGLSAFEEESVRLETPRDGTCAVVAGDRAFVIGGRNTFGQSLKSVEEIALDAEGRIRGITTSGQASILVARTEAACAVVGRSVYVIGGWDGSKAIASVEKANLLADGSLGPFAPVTGANLAVARSSMGASVASGSVYVVGGYNETSGAVGSVERAPILADGSLGPFTATGIALSTARFYGFQLFTGRLLDVLGGSVNAKDYLRDAETVRLADDDTLSLKGPFAGYVQGGLEGPTAVVTGDAIYSLGGGSAVGRTRLPPDSSYLPFAPYSNLVRKRRFMPGSFVAGNYLYVVGGTDEANSRLGSVERATLR